MLKIIIFTWLCNVVLRPAMKFLLLDIYSSKQMWRVTSGLKAIMSLHSPDKKYTPSFSQPNSEPCKILYPDIYTLRLLNTEAFGLNIAILDGVKGNFLIYAKTCGAFFSDFSVCINHFILKGFSKYLICCKQR